MSYKKIIISPHIDDDILGCGGILDENSLVIYCGVDDFHVVGRKDRIKEAESASKLLGHSYEILHGNKVNHYDAVDLIDEISSYINKYKPEQVYVPYPSYNQDHRAVYEASMVSLRPHDVNFFVKEVFVYEQPHTFFWNHTYNLNSPQFIPNYFIPIDVDRKLSAYAAMASQNRTFRSPEHVMALSTVRGGQANCQHAEAFQIIRMAK
jgi:LmbE family N-acetylglucosaminyl deacetylase|tara:strand:- start:11075 stop:11698 length:624 start_codon:yes stop_codon:yes gene_type:complete